MSNLIIFGASGDISKKKVYPALYEWYNDNIKDNKDNKVFFNNIIGYGRTQYTQTKFHELININNNKFLKYFDYQTGQYDSYDDFIKLKHKIINSNIKKKDILIMYFGVPYQVIYNILKNISLSQISNDYDCRYILEKPIGNSLDDCTQILNKIENIISVDNIYILDHYLGKSSIVNMINTKKESVNKIEIFLYEKETVDHRIQYFNDVGLFKDMIQSHVMIILVYCFPNLFSGLTVSSLKVVKYERGQYNGYSGNKNIDTYIRLHLEWNNVEIIIKAGKGLNIDKKEIHYTCNNKIKIIPISSTYSEYKILFQDVLNKNKSKYLDSYNIKYFWRISDHILKNINNNNIFYYDVPMIVN